MFWQMYAQGQEAPASEGGGRGLYGETRDRGRGAGVAFCHGSGCQPPQPCTNSNSPSNK